MHTATTIARFFRRFTIDLKHWHDGTPCWRWTASLNKKNGYGKISVRHPGSRKLHCRWAHRVSYEIAVGPIPEGLEIDHRCRNKWCVNPDHLEAVTHRENIRRAHGLDGGCPDLNCCPNGHRYDEANTYIDPRGWRQCRTCRRDEQRRRTLAA